MVCDLKAINILCCIFISYVENTHVWK